ncbi:N-acetyltransferase GCN5 [Litchfieldella qijiaojingensis]|uniref:N-acetyltransferase GCN5 n=1 Tax=Litchfieldella qijiaojingensis TaxID=980347 RepID=A0ABQ2YSJ8_9GAMM|nr:GNAT family N-acetyltransferase [Halomonas qijiaojingensis]GGX94024.1 N-acetyltransferase GCN5 [Halomonas qijiaojingensis]
MENISIVRLSADSPHATTVAGWTYAEWGYLHPEESAEAYCEAFVAQCGEGGVPSVFVAMHGEAPVGTASLVVDDMSVRPELTPWLASVFVLPAWRGRGIASRLVQRVEHEAREWGIERCYLFTPDQQALYRRLGWRDHESLSYRGEEVTIMTRALTIGPA